ncbi:MAG: type III pantothenate kinase [Gemmatimonadetes bacterium]|nr:MAG: type III pantothenate kinase [Gemmatimonadota bacterium]
MARATLLAIDIGNTHTVIGVYHATQLLYLWRINSDRERTVDEVGVWVHDLFRIHTIDPATLQHGIIASVVPRLTRTFTEMMMRYFDLSPLVVTHQIPLGIELRVDYPAEVGADRLVNSVAALHLYADNCIVVDFGTATTFDVVAKEGAYLGGVISPGIQTAASSLADNAAQLYRVPLTKPPRVIGKSTIEAMQAGIFYGAVGQCDAIVRQLKAEWGVESCKVIATGGLATLLVTDSHEIETVHEDLTLLGLRLIAERNFSTT